MTSPDQPHNKGMENGDPDDIDQDDSDIRHLFSAAVPAEMAAIDEAIFDNAANGLPSSDDANSAHIAASSTAVNTSDNPAVGDLTKRRTQSSRTPRSDTFRRVLPQMFAAAAVVVFAIVLVPLVQQPDSFKLDDDPRQIAESTAVNEVPASKETASADQPEPVVESSNLAVAQPLGVSESFIQSEHKEEKAGAFTAVSSDSLASDESPEISDQNETPDAGTVILSLPVDTLLDTDAGVNAELSADTEAGADAGVSTDASVSVEADAGTEAGASTDANASTIVDLSADEDASVDAAAGVDEDASVDPDRSGDADANGDADVSPDDEGAALLPETEAAPTIIISSTDESEVVSNTDTAPVPENQNIDETTTPKAARITTISSEKSSGPEIENIDITIDEQASPPAAPVNIAAELVPQSSEQPLADLRNEDTLARSWAVVNGATTGDESGQPNYRKSSNRWKAEILKMMARGRLDQAEEEHRLFKLKFPSNSFSEINLKDIE